MKKIAIASLLVGIGGCAVGIAGFVVGLADLGSAEGEDGIPWIGLFIMGGFFFAFLGPMAFSLASDFVRALETKWSQRPPDRPAH